MSQWHHQPTHVFLPGQFYMVTAGTLYKAHHFQGMDRLSFLQEALMDALHKNGWIAQSWAVFPNHYHFIAQAPENAETLKLVIKALHAHTAGEINRRDLTVGRQVWYQYWDTCLTYEKSYLVRLNYVNNNPVRHGIVPVATQYPFCSANWFEQHAEPGFRRKVASFRYDRLKIIDDF
jgi:putative transposase